MNKLIMGFLCLTLALTSCRPTNAPKKLEDCRYSKPTAIFSDQMPGVRAHRFSAEPYSATEEFQLGDSLFVTLIQSGCDQPKQEFRFVLKQKPDQELTGFCISKCIEILYSLSRLSTGMAPLAAWAQAIEANAPNIILGESVMIQQDTYVKLDQVPTAEGVILLLTLGAQP